MNLSSSYIGSGPGWKCVTPEPSRPMYTYISEFQTLFSL